MIAIDILQKTYIDNLTKTQSLVSVFLINSISLKGYLMAYNEETIFLKLERITQLIYKYKISTICPEISFSRFNQQNEDFA